VTILYLRHLSISVVDGTCSLKQELPTVATECVNRAAYWPASVHGSCQCRSVHILTRGCNFFSFTYLIFCNFLVSSVLFQPFFPFPHWLQFHSTSRPIGLWDVDASTFFYIIGSQMVVNLSAIRARRPLPAGRFLVLISVRGWVNPRAIVWMKGLCQLKNPIISPGIELATFRLVS
jgi:hypothetical protein